jgi:hypothetical protein
MACFETPRGGLQNDALTQRQAVPKQPKMREGMGSRAQDVMCALRCDQGLRLLAKAREAAAAAAALCRL